MPQLVAAAANSMHLLLLAALLPRAAFGQYAVWNGYYMVAIGVTQALNGEAQLLRLRRHGDRRDPVLLAGLVAGALLAVPGYLVGGWALVCASAAIPAVVAWDYWRFQSMRSKPGRVVLEEGAVTIVQVVAVISLRNSVPGAWLPSLWWAIGGTGFALLLLSKGKRPALLAEVRVTRLKAAEFSNIIFDALLAGAPVTLGLQLLLARGVVEDAADLRLVLAVLGPLSVVTLLARRFLFLGLGREVRARALYLLAALPSALSILYAGLLISLLSTGVVAAVLPEYSGLSAGLVMLLAINGSIVSATSLPNGQLRQAGQTQAIRNGRLIGLIPFLLLTPWFTSAGMVAAASTAYVLSYAAWVWVAARRLPRLSAMEDMARVDIPPSG